MRAFLENPLFVLFPAYILDLTDPGACYEYWKNGKIAKMALLKFEIFFLTKSILLKHHENANKEKYS